jgi:hypothetical protein
MTRSRGMWAAWLLAFVTAGLLSDVATAATGPDARAARRRWALARMDEMAHERLRCRERFQKRQEVERCEADYDRRFREYNEMYLEAARD